MSHRKRSYIVHFQNGRSATVLAKGKRMAIAKARVEAGPSAGEPTSWHKVGAGSWFGSQLKRRF